jgi:C-terminal processing protease CtpA/Prc
MRSITNFLLLLIFITTVFTACEKDDKDPETPSENQPTEIAEFIWDGLNTYYLWTNDVPALNLTQGSDEWKKTLNAHTTDYEALFNSFLYLKNAKGEEIDRWSWIVDDYVKQEEAFSGVSKSFGFEFRLSKYSNSDGVFGYVTYILPNSPASETDLKRGNIFVSVDGTDLNTSNYRDLLFSQDSYTLGLADLSSTGITDNNKNVSITAIENFEENPILLTKILENEGGKTGYMVYNSFIGTDKFNLALNDSIGKLKDSGVTEMVIDLRYNGGGSLYTDQLLCSMLTGEHTGELLFESKYNETLTNHYIDSYGQDALKDFFVDKIKDNKGSTLASINSLNLNRLFVLTSGSSASASEQLINGLEPYIDVVLIGTTTSGKYTSSITVYDYVDNNGTKNPKHTWAMQPIVGKVANSQGDSDFGNGFTPDYTRNEWDYLGDIKPLGDIQEPLLAAALGIIEGISVPQTLQAKTKAYGIHELKELFNSKNIKRFSKELIDDNHNRRRLNLKDIVK